MNYNKDILNRFINEKVVINVETQQEWIDFMELLEKATDCKWVDGQRPTQFNDWDNYQDYTSVVFNDDGDVGLGFGTYDYFEEEGYKVIKYKDLVKVVLINYNKEILNRFLTEKVAINVETKQEWEDFMELLESETDCKWSPVKLPTDVRDWTQNNEDTAVVLNYFGDNGLGHSPCDFFQNDGYEVIKYKYLTRRINNDKH